MSGVYKQTRPGSFPTWCVCARSHTTQSKSKHTSYGILANRTLIRKSRGVQEVSFSFHIKGSACNRLCVTPPPAGEGAGPGQLSLRRRQGRGNHRGVHQPGAAQPHQRGPEQGGRNPQTGQTKKGLDASAWSENRIFGLVLTERCGCSWS